MSKEERSKRMSLIRSKWTNQEKWFHNYLKGHKINHKMHPRLKGAPDLILKDKKLAIFLHGCFWHGCKKCYRAPRTNKKFWKEKLERNISRDKQDQRQLKKQGWKVMIIWEHEIPRHNPWNEIRKIIARFS